MPRVTGRDAWTGQTLRASCRARIRPGPPTVPDFDHPPAFPRGADGSRTVRSRTREGSMLHRSTSSPNRLAASATNAGENGKRTHPAVGRCPCRRSSVARTADNHLWAGCIASGVVGVIPGGAVRAPPVGLGQRPRCARWYGPACWRQRLSWAHTRLRGLPGSAAPRRRWGGGSRGAVCPRGRRVTLSGQVRVGRRVDSTATAAIRPRVRSLRRVRRRRYG